MLIGVIFKTFSMTSHSNMSFKKAYSQVLISSHLSSFLLGQPSQGLCWIEIGL